MGNNKKKKTQKIKPNKREKKQNQKTNRSFWEISKNIFKEAGIWIFSVIILGGIYGIIMGSPLLFTMHRSLYVIGMALGIYAILESIIKKDRSLKEKEARKLEAERVRKRRNMGIYRGFMVMGAAFILELIDYFIL